MLRKTLTILSLIGLLLSVGLWGVSWYGVTYKKMSKIEGTELFAIHGSLWVIVWTGTDLQYLLPIIPRGWTFGNVPNGMRVHGFIPWFENQVVPTDYGTMQYSSLVLPLYIPILILAILPLLAGRRIHRRRKRMKLGLCLKCGYDLRASKDRCPECGENCETTRP